MIVSLGPILRRFEDGSEPEGVHGDGPAPTRWASIPETQLSVRGSDCSLGQSVGHRVRAKIELPIQYGQGQALAYPVD